MNRRYTLKAALGAIAGLFAGNAAAKSSQPSYNFNVLSADETVDRERLKELYGQMAKEFDESGEVSIAGDEKIVVNSVGANAVNKVDQTKYLETRVYGMEVSTYNNEWISWVPHPDSIREGWMDNIELALDALDVEGRRLVNSKFRLVKRDVIMQIPKKRVELL